MTPQTQDCIIKHDALLMLVFEVVIRFLRSSPLHESSREGHLEVCRELISSNADVNAKTDDGYDCANMRIFYENECDIAVYFQSCNPFS